MPSYAHQRTSAWTRYLLATCGVLSLGLGLLGIFLPLLPTTPFILLAAYLFSRSSPRLHEWLLSHPLCGPAIRSWNETRTLPIKTKCFALLLVVISFSASIALVSFIPARFALGILGVVLLGVILRIPHHRPS